MRTLFEIVEGAKEGKKPTHDECYYAMLALSVLHYLAKIDTRDLAAAIREQKPSMKLREQLTTQGAFDRDKKAFARCPKEWLGNEVPENPEYQKMRATAFKVLEKATGIKKESLS